MNQYESGVHNLICSWEVIKLRREDQDEGATQLGTVFFFIPPFPASWLHEVSSFAFLMPSH